MPLPSCLVLTSLVVAAPHFNAPLPDQVTLAKTAKDKDVYGQKIDVKIFQSHAKYKHLKRFYQRRFSRKKMIRVVETRESIHPDQVPDPRDPSTTVMVLRVLNLNYTESWAAVFVRPFSSGTLIAVLERKRPPELSGGRPPKRFEIPRSVFEVGAIRPLTRR